MRDEKINKNELDETLEKELNKEFKEDLFKLDRCGSPLSGLKPIAWVFGIIIYNRIIF